MSAGSSRHRVLLQAAIDTVNDTTGGVARTWDDIGYWHCEIRPTTVREAFIDGGIRDEADVRLVGLFNSRIETLKAADRAVSVDGATFYNLAGPPMVSNDRREAVLRARVGMNDGR